MTPVTGWIIATCWLRRIPIPPFPMHVSTTPRTFSLFHPSDVEQSVCGRTLLTTTAAGRIWWQSWRANDALTRNMRKSVLIQGASIAGPALAYWLARYGYAVTIVERSSGLRRGGYGVDVRGTAIEVAKRMEVLNEVKAADTCVRGVDFVDASGNAVAQLHEAAV